MNHSIATYQPHIPFDTESAWLPVRDGNLFALDIFTRHYTYRESRRKSGVNSNRFINPGERIVLLSQNGQALFAWTKQKFRNDNQEGVCCSIFRNESELKSSELILQAEKFAWARWPDQRLFTFVDSRKIRSTNPGYCFQKADWKKCGFTKSKKLIILEKLPS